MVSAARAGPPAQLFTHRVDIIHYYKKTHSFSLSIFLQPGDRIFLPVRENVGKFEGERHVHRVTLYGKDEGARPSVVRQGIIHRAQSCRKNI